MAEIPWIQRKWERRDMKIMKTEDGRERRESGRGGGEKPGKQDCEEEGRENEIREDAECRTRRTDD